MKFEFSAGGIIYRHKGQKFEIALILDSYDKWTFPKGHLEKNEKPELGAKREVGEEIGLKDFQKVELLDKIDYWFRLKKQLIHKFVYFYLMEAKADARLEPQTTEIKEAKWFSPAEAKTILGYKKDSLPLLEKAFSRLNIML